MEIERAADRGGEGRERVGGGGEGAHVGAPDHMIRVGEIGLLFRHLWSHLNDFGAEWFGVRG